jgi:hypothetical protein
MSRLEAILDELQKSDKLSRTIKREQPELKEKINVVREIVDALKSE